MVFKKMFRCVSGVYADKPGINNGGKIILPHSCFAELAKLEITYPMMFRVVNPENGKSSHCGVLEFTAQEGTVVAPYWLLELLGLEEGGIMNVVNTSLPRGSYIKIQPEKAFVDLSNPRAVLESRMNGYSCLTKGDRINIHYNDRDYPINILEVKVGDRDTEAISIVETNINTDFARPSDMPPSPEAAPAPAPAMSSGLSFGNSLLNRNDSEASAAKKPEPETPPVTAARGSSFQAFSGSGRTLRPGGAKPASGDSGSNAGTPTYVATDSLGRPLKRPSEVAAEAKPGFTAFQGQGRKLK